MNDQPERLKLRPRGVRTAIVLDGTRAATARLLHALADAGIREAILVGGAAEPVPPLRVHTASSFEDALAQCPPEIDVLVCDPSHADGPDWVSALIEEGRPNVAVVQPRLTHQLDRTATKFVLEPVDVPWYSRQIVALSTDVTHELAHGEVLSFGVISGAARAACSPSRSFEALCAAIIDSRQPLYTHAVAAPAWSISA